MKRLVYFADKGDMRAMKLIFERELPINRGRPIDVYLPEIVTPEDLPKATAALANGVLSGEISCEDALAVTRVLNVHMDALKWVDLARRVDIIEGDAASPDGLSRDDERT